MCIRDSLVYFEYLVYFVYLVYIVYLVYLSTKLSIKEPYYKNTLTKGLVYLVYPLYFV